MSAIFKSQLFIPSNKRFAKWSGSEKAFGRFAIAVLLLGICALILNESGIENRKFLSIIKVTTIFLDFFALINFFIAILGPFLEEEPLSGTFTENLVIDYSGITVNDKFYPYSDIKGFDIEIKNYYGKRTNNSRFGPRYYQGIDNKIFFILPHRTIHDYFLISSEEDNRILENLLIHIITEEKIRFKNKYLYLLPNGYKKTDKYLTFIKKLKKEKRIFNK